MAQFELHRVTEALDLMAESARAHADYWGADSPGYKTMHDLAIGALILAFRVDLINLEEFNRRWESLDAERAKEQA